MAGLFDDAIIEDYGNAIPTGNTQSTHRCCTLTPLHICRADFEFVNLFDPALASKLLDSGVVIEDIEIEDAELLADISDEIHQIIGDRNVSGNRDLHKFAAEVRRNGDVITLSNTHNILEIRSLSLAAGNGLSEF